MFHQTASKSLTEAAPMDSLSTETKTIVRMQKILIIDDDPDIITVLQMLLKKKGYQVATASREEEAYRQIDAFTPNLIVMDVLLSGVDGRQVCKKIKNTEAWKHILVIMFSAHPGAQKNMADYGADDFLPKPFQSDKLLERIEVQLARQQHTL